EQVLVGAAILVGDLHDQPEVGLDQLASRLGVAVLDQPRRERALFLRGEQRIAPRLAHVHGHRVALGERAFAARCRRRRVVTGDAVGIDRRRSGREVDVGALGGFLGVLGLVAIGPIASIWPAASVWSVIPISPIGPVGLVASVLPLGVVARPFSDVDNFCL